MCGPPAPPRHRLRHPFLIHEDVLLRRTGPRESWVLPLPRGLAVPFQQMGAHLGLWEGQQGAGNRALGGAVWGGRLA